MRQREEVAASGAGSLQGRRVQDYEFLEGPRSLDDGDKPVTTVRLSQLSAPLTAHSWSST